MKNILMIHPFKINDKVKFTYWFPPFPLLYGTISSITLNEDGRIRNYEITLHTTYTLLDGTDRFVKVAYVQPNNVMLDGTSLVKVI